MVGVIQLTRVQTMHSSSMTLVSRDIHLLTASFPGSFFKDTFDLMLRASSSSFTNALLLQVFQRGGSQAEHVPALSPTSRVWPLQHRSSFRVASVMGAGGWILAGLEPPTLAISHNGERHQRRTAVNEVEHFEVLGRLTNLEPGYRY